MPGSQSVTSEYLNDLKALDHLNSPKKEKKFFGDPFEIAKGFPLEELRYEKEITKTE